MMALLQQSRSKNTSKKYGYAFNAWKEFIESRGGTIIPSKPMEVSLFLTHKITTSNASAQSVLTSVYAIKWFNELSGFDFNIDHPYVKNLMEAAKRLPKQPTKRKDIVSGASIIQVCVKFQAATDLLVIRDLCFITLCFAGFFPMLGITLPQSKSVQVSGVSYEDLFRN